jgi:biopolymer transport protein ExbD
MRLPARTVRGGVGMNMTPMIDVVFQLIIFFLLASHLGQQESQLPLALPEAATGAADLHPEARRVTIQVRPDGGFLVAGNLADDAAVDRLLGVEAARAGRGLQVRIRSDRDVAFRRVESILGACAKHGVWDVSFVVTRPLGK